MRVYLHALLSLDILNHIPHNTSRGKQWQVFIVARMVQNALAVFILGSGYFAGTGNVNFDLTLPVMHCTCSDQAWLDVEDGLDERPTNICL